MPKFNDRLAAIFNAMDRSMRVNGAPTRDTMFRDSVVKLNENLAVVLNKSNLIPTQKLDTLREALFVVDLLVTKIRNEEGI